jgi:hypothetical protein
MIMNIHHLLDIFKKRNWDFFLKIGNKGNRQNKLVKTSKNGKIWGGKKNDNH